MTRAQPHGIRRTGEVDVVAGHLGHLHGIAQGVDAVEGRSLQFVDTHAYFLLHVSGHVTEIGHQGVQFALLTQVFYTQRLHLLGIAGLHCIHLFQQFLNPVNHSLFDKFHAKVRNNS